MEQSLEKQLKITAAKVRLGILEGVYHAKSGHPGGSLSAADIITYLYFREMRVDPQRPQWEDRDRFVLSKGHGAPALYAALALKGFFPMEEMKKLRHVGAMLQGHPDMKGTPGVDMSTGSLGQGISAACGIALAGKLSKKDFRVYAMHGDGELEEGQVWEAAMFASHKKLDNLCVIVDYNDLQISGHLHEVCSPEPITDKFAAFGFHVISINGHDFSQIEHALLEAKSVTGKPTAIIASTHKGQGVSFMQDNVGWHGVAPNSEQYHAAIKEIEQYLADLEG